MATANQRLAALEAFMKQQKEINILVSESIKTIESKLESTSVPTPTETTIPPISVGSKYLTFPISAALVISAKGDIIIENLRFENTLGASIYISNGFNITIRNCFFNKSAAESIVLEGCTNITVQNCLFYGMTCGVYATTSKTIKVIDNQFVNSRMRREPDGTYSARGQFVQFNNVTGAGNEVSGNRGESFFADYNASALTTPGISNPEDCVSIYKSFGTSTSPILVRNNLFRGGGPSVSGGGIVAGDNGGDYIRIENNQLVNPGNYGIAVVGGRYNVLNNNRVYSDFHSYNNAGVIIWAQGKDPVTGNTIACSNVTYTNNHINFPYKNGLGQNNLFFEGNCGTLIQSGNIYDESLSVMMPTFPINLITFVTSEELLKIRGK